MSHDPARCPHCLNAGLTPAHWTAALTRRNTTS